MMMMMTRQKPERASDDDDVVENHEQGADRKTGGWMVEGEVMERRERWYGNGARTRPDWADGFLLTLKTARLETPMRSSLARRGGAEESRTSARWWVGEHGYRVIGVFQLWRR